MATSTDIAYYETRIRGAYQVLAATPGEWVSLTRLREQIGGHRDLVDAALRQLGRAEDVNIAPENNQKTLTAWDRECALYIGGQDKHLIAIGV